MQYPASFSESLGDHELKPPFFCALFKGLFFVAQEEVDAILFRESNGGQSTAHQALSVLDAICRGDGTKVLVQRIYLWMSLKTLNTC